ncbi:hypothetical protein QQF64_010527, partial [Cirrhinus molitorella]
MHFSEPYSTSFSFFHSVAPFAEKKSILGREQNATRRRASKWRDGNRQRREERTSAEKTKKRRNSTEKKKAWEKK